VTQGRLVEQAYESLQLQLDSGRPSVDAVAGAVVMVIAYVLPRPGCRELRMEQMLKNLLELAQDPVNVLGFACIFSILLKTVGDVSAAQKVLEEDRVRMAFIHLEERIRSASLCDQSAGSYPSVCCPRCQRHDSGDWSETDELVTDVCICAELKAEKDVTWARASVGLTHWTCDGASTSGFPTPEPGPAVKDWDAVHIRNWLRAWGVSDPVVDALFTAGVDGKQFVSLYRDACHKVFSRPSGSCWTAIVGDGDPASMETKLDRVMRAGEYAEGADFLLPPGDWVRSALIDYTVHSVCVLMWFSLFIHFSVCGTFVSPCSCCRQWVPGSDDKLKQRG
jgi:hypothetical protein